LRREVNSVPQVPKRAPSPHPHRDTRWGPRRGFSSIVSSSLIKFRVAPALEHHHRAKHPEPVVSTRKRATTGPVLGSMVQLPKDGCPGVSHSVRNERGPRVVRPPLPYTGTQPNIHCPGAILFKVFGISYFLQKLWRFVKS